MIKTLRSRFMLSNLALVMIIIIMFFGSLTIVSYVFERQQTEEILTIVLENVKNVPDAIVVDREGLSNSVNEEDTLSRLRTVIVIAQTDENGNITAYGIDDSAEVTFEDIRPVVDMVVNSNELSGRSALSGLVVRYMKMPNGVGGYKIAFSDASTEFVTIRFMMRVYFFAGLFFFAIMFMISDYMAYKAIIPVEKSWENQKRFVADASHELKTPLTVILANMDIMSANPDSTIEEQKKWIENTKSEATRMTELVNDMLFLARGDAGHEQVFSFMNTDVSSLVRDCVLTFESVAFEKGVELIEDISDNICIKVDETKLKQAIIILIDNALKYVDENGKIAVSLTQVGRVPGKNNIKISVVNTGEPIPADKQRHVFERFFRVDESRKRDKGGYGLGLAIAANIMEAHGGKICLDYSDMRGTCFSLILPVKQSGRFIRKRKHT